MDSICDEVKHDPSIEHISYSLWNSTERRVFLAVRRVKGSGKNKYSGKFGLNHVELTVVMYH
jgi:hypothetical protein